MAVAKRQGREKPAKIDQRKVRTGVRTSGKTNSTPGWPSLHRTGPGRDKRINRGAKASSLSLSPACWDAFLLVSLDHPHASEMDFPAIF